MSSRQPIARALARGRAAALLWISACGAGWLLVEYTAPLRDAELMLSDLRLAFSDARTTVRDDIVVLTITEETLAGLPYRSPIARGFLADALVAVQAKEPRAIGIDIIFDKATVPTEDAALRSALRSASVPVVVAIGDDRVLTPEQLEFQLEYLKGVHVGSSNLAETAGTVRHIYLGSASAPSFIYSLARLIGLNTGLPADGSRLPELDYPPLTDNGALPIARYPLQHVGFLPDEWITGKVVLIGGDLRAQDRHQTPYSIRGGAYRSTPGVMIHAMALAQLMDGRARVRLSPYLEAMLVALAGAAGLAIYWLRLWGAVGIAATYLVLAFGSSSLPFLSPLLAFALSGGSAALMFGRAERLQRAYLEDTFGHFVSPQILEALQEAPESLELGGETREMSFVFTDLASFTAMTERLPARVIVEVLQRYLGGLVEVALAHDATIDSFVGDGIHVFFNAPVEQTDHARRAINCALAMDEFAEAFRSSEAQQGYGLGVTRIGVHTGPAIVGKVGGERLFSYTAHGDVVNTVARLEAANKVMGTRICVSAAAAAYHPELPWRAVGKLLLRGKNKTVDVVTLGEDVDGELRERYTVAYGLLESDDDRARAAFEELAACYPEDPLVALHLRRLEAGEHGVIVRIGGDQ